MHETGQNPKLVQREEVLREKITIWDRFLEQGRSDGGKGGPILNGGPSKNEKGREKLPQQEPNQMIKITKKREDFKGGQDSLQQERAKIEQNTFL